MHDAFDQFRRALRALRIAPGFTLTAVVTLGLAIGASAAIYTLVDAVLLAPLPYADADRLVVLKGSAPGADVGDEFDLATEFQIEYARAADLLDSVAAVPTFTSTLRTDERVDRVVMSAPTPSLFEMLGVRPEIGRLPVSDDGTTVALLSHGLWTEWFGGDPNVLGRTAFVAGATRTIIGVMPRDFDFPRGDIRIWFPNPLLPIAAMPNFRPGDFGVPLVARVKPGVALDALTAQLGLIARQLPEQYGGSPTYRGILERFKPIVVPLEQQMLGPLARPLWILLGATGILLSIACANVANLFLARATRQQREAAIRRAIGASRAKLVLRQLTETTVVATLAGLLALGVAASLLPIIVAQVPVPVPRLHSAGFSLTTILFTLGVSAVAALACGLVPAMRAARVNLVWLTEGSRGITEIRHWTREGLIVAQAALALMLLFASGLLLRSFVELRGVDPGYATENIFTFQIAPEQAQLKDGPSWSNFYLGFMERLRAVPGIETVGTVENFPLNERTAQLDFSTDATADRSPVEYRLAVTFTAGDYFQAMGIPLLRGRLFTEAEQRANTGPVIVSRSTAERLWPGENPIGKRLTLSQFGFSETVIGVVGDVRQNGFREEGGPDVYFPLVGQLPDMWPLGTPAIVVKTQRASSIAPEIRALVREVAPEAPMYRAFTIRELVADSMNELTFTMIALVLAAGLALLLGVVGLYGILSAAVAERTRELGIRLALGAPPTRVQRMVVVRGTAIVAIGIGVGIVGVLLGAPTLEKLLYGVGAFDVVTLVSTSLLLMLVSVAASWIPAYRASRVDPARTLADA